MNKGSPLILVVDDDVDLLVLVEEALLGKGYRVTTARDGLEALTRIAEAEPQLILLDMRMPEMDGWTFARAFRELYDERIPIIVATAAADSKLRAAEISANGYLDKPFELSRLYHVVEATLATAK